MSVPKPDSVRAHARTRQQLIEAAGRVFADTGFHDATVRDIGMKAGTNSAAISYHFGDKKTLYLEVLRFAVVMANEKYPLDMGLGPEATPEMRLRAFIHAFLLRLLDPGPISWSGKLVAREMIKPTLALEDIINDSIKPMDREIVGIVKELLGRKSTPEKVRHGRFSVVSQCLFYHHCRHVLVRLSPDEQFTPRAIEKLADHITEFSLGGLQRIAKN